MRKPEDAKSNQIKGKSMHTFSKQQTGSDKHHGSLVWYPVMSTFCPMTRLVMTLITASCWLGNCVDVWSFRTSSAEYSPPLAIS